MRTLRFAFGTVVVTLICSVAFAAPKLSKGTTAEGVIAYQDDADPTQFYYFPARVPLVLNDTLTDFKVKYWGVTKPFSVEQTDGSWKSIIGATVSGRAVLDMTKPQRAAITAEIKKTFGIANPKLLPLMLKNVTVQPVLAQTTLGIANGGDLTFPTTVTFAAPFAYSVGTPNNRLFAQYTAAQLVGDDTAVEPDPSFAVNIVGDAEFVGDPWEYDCKADLSQVWRKSRTSVNASVGLGWFQIGSAQYASIVQDLIRTSTIDCNFKEGSLDTEKFGRQILELGKKVLEALNTKATSGEGFFRFEPNPEPPDVNAGSTGGGWWPWHVSINAAYSSAAFDQKISWSQHVKYTGHLLWKMPTSMVLAVSCNSATKDSFVELGNSEACITPEKAERLNDRVEREKKAKNEKIKRLLARLEAGEISPEQYQKILAIYNTISFTEDVSPSGTPRALTAETFDFKGVNRAQARTLSLGYSDADIRTLEEGVIAQTVRDAKRDE